ncbi:hypothetical protein Taro_004339 [Colocasia esculenta]|uniref:Uncharacterized protein n=1 Tax=Colocasia esculenta TaxID=4460 RepID=A0A843TM35_COLES|nr:hypothetical protein [Colocasia esculenta]
MPISIATPSRPPAKARHQKRGQTLKTKKENATAWQVASTLYAPATRHDRSDRWDSGRIMSERSRDSPRRRDKDAMSTPVARKTRQTGSARHQTRCGRPFWHDHVAARAPVATLRTGPRAQGGGVLQFQSHNDFVML